MAHHKLAKTKAVPKSKIQNPQQQFQAHWATIEKLQRDIATQHTQQEALLARFREEVLPIEHQYIQALYDKTSRLLSFINKKSLGESNRGALLSWIEEEFDELFNYPFNEQVDLEALRQQFFAAGTFIANKMADFEPAQDEIDIFRQQIDETLGFDSDFDDEELVTMMLDPEKLFTTMQRLINEAENNPYIDDEYDDAEDDDTQTPDSAPQNLDNLLKSQEVNKMYKKLAGILHPDRERDPVKKEEKHLLMVQLSKAKKAHDIWTILGMYHQYVDSEFHFSQAEMPALNAMLQQRIAALNAELAGEHAPGSLSSMIWKRFGAKTVKTINNRLKKHCEELQEMIEAETQMREELRSLAALKRHLSALRNQRSFESMIADLF